MRRPEDDRRAAGSRDPLAGPEVAERTLANGLRVRAVPLPHLHTAVVTVFVQAGSRYETRETNGLSHMLEHMLFRGTATHPSAYELNLAIEELGGTLNAATHVDYTMYATPVPVENLAESLSLFGEIFHTPQFHDLEVEKRILREEILEDLDEDGHDVDADNVARQLLFSPHPLGAKITGELDNVRRFEVDDLHAHMQRLYGARNMVLCVAGAIDPASVFAWAEQSMGALAPGTATETDPFRAHSADGTRFAYTHEAGSQTDVRLSFLTFGMNDPRYAALQLMARILDDGLSSRLPRRLTDERGLAYEAFGSLETYEDCGVLDLGTSVEHGKTPEVVRELLQLTRELRTDIVESRELERARQRHLWDLAATIDDPDEIATFYGTSALFRTEDTIARSAEAARAVTADDIRAVARELTAPGRAHVACVGVLDDTLQSETRTTLEQHG